jgi:hypothetical protein
MTRPPASREVDGSFDGISMAPALDTAAAVIILAVALSCEALLGPKSSKRIPAVLAIATITVTVAGLRAAFRYLLGMRISCLTSSTVS